MKCLFEDSGEYHSTKQHTAENEYETGCNNTLILYVVNALEVVALPPAVLLYL